MSKLINCLIVEDEPLASKVIEKYISQIDNLSLVAKCTNAIEAFNVLGRRKVDLIFLDIKMPQITGVEFLKTLKNPPAVIFTTAYREFAIEGFELDVVDYLLKPVSFERFIRAVNKVIEKYRPIKNSNDISEDNEKDYIFVKSDKKMVKINLSDIHYVEGLKDYIQIVAEGNKIVTYLSLSAMEENLPSHKFIRIHRSFIVSIDKIKAFSALSVELPNKTLTIGRHYKKNVLEVLNNKHIIE